jgi:hypothetical protein
MGNNRRTMECTPRARSAGLSQCNFSLLALGDARRSLAQESMAMNPSQAPTIDRDALPIGQTSLVCASILLAWFTAIVASALSFGAHGFGLGLYIVACSWFIITRIDANLLWPLNRAKPTAVECLVVLAICGVLHGFALPAVTTNCVGRRQTNATLSTNVSATKSSDYTTSATTIEPPP